MLSSKLEQIESEAGLVVSWTPGVQVDIQFEVANVGSSLINYQVLLT